MRGRAKKGKFLTAETQRSEAATKVNEASCGVSALRLCAFASWRYKWGVYVLVDNKATTEWHPVFEAQMVTYLRVTGLKLGARPGD